MYFIQALLVVSVLGFVVLVLGFVILEPGIARSSRGRNSQEHAPFVKEKEHVLYPGTACGFCAGLRGSRAGLRDSGARNSQEQPGAAKSNQGQSGAARRSREKTEAV